MLKHFLSLDDYSSDQLQTLLNLSVQLKQLYRNGSADLCLAGKNAVLLFEKPSSRTRISFQVALNQLGAGNIYIRPEDSGRIGQREPISDLVRVLNGYTNAIIVRTFGHEIITEIARYATVPVINALTDLAHPCQAMADILTIHEQFGRLKNLKLAYIGDSNNVTYSLAMACARFDIDFAAASPPGYTFPKETIDHLQMQANSSTMEFIENPKHAVQNADIIYTDTWTSMGQEQEKEKRTQEFKGYQLNRQLIQASGKESKIMHCLPAYRGLEITDDIIESPQSIVFPQAENRLHFQRALLKYLMTQTF